MIDHNATSLTANSASVIMPNAEFVPVRFINHTGDSEPYRTAVVRSYLKSVIPSPNTVATIDIDARRIFVLAPRLTS